MAAKEIPGFYYDSEKRRYFRKLPGHLCLTAVERPPSPLPVVQPSSSSSSLLPQLYQTLRSTHISPQPSTRSVYTALATTVKCREETTLGDSGTSCSGLAASPSGRLLAVACNTTDLQTDVSVLKLDGPVSQLCADQGVWQERDLQSGSPYGSVMHFGARDNTDILLVLKQSATRRAVLCRAFSDGKPSSTWHQPLPASSASLTAVAGDTSQSNWLGAVGLSSGKVACLYADRSEATPLWLSPPAKSAILSLAFAPQGQCLFAGYQNGKIIQWDLRRNPRQRSVVMETKQGRINSSVISLHVTGDGYLLISSALNSRLGVWDLRMQRKLWQFKEHVNGYQPCSSAVGWDNSLLCAGGSDGAVRLWCLSSGQLCRTIPSIARAHVAFTSSACFEHHPAIFISDNDKLKLFKP